MEVCVLSPHPDDAAFSCALLMQSLLSAGVRLRIINVCTRSSYAPYLTPSQPCTLADVSAIRKQEDETFLQLLTIRAQVSDDAVQIDDLGWLDAPDRWSIPPECTLQHRSLMQEEVRSLRTALQRLGTGDLVLAPLALGGHVDHRLAQIAALSAIPAEMIAFYEDLPYAARLGERRSQENFSPHPDCNFRCFPLRPLAGGGGKKHYALCYCSQIDEATAQEIDNYSQTLGGRERIYGTRSALERINALLHE